MFKKIVAAIAAINTQDDFNRVCGMIEIAFQHEKINWNDRGLLFGLIGKINIEE